LTIEDVLSVELETGRPVPTVVAGEPYESWHVIFDDGRVELGIWEVTPGSFRGSADGIHEQMHFVAGSGTITDADGVVTTIRPGVVMLARTGGQASGTCVRPSARRTRSSRPARRAELERRKPHKTLTPP
jgi:uncharacterized cupin superfamily protein